MNATTVRYVLISGLVLCIVAMGTTIYFGKQYLTGEATKTVHTKIDAELSTADGDRLRNLKRELELNKSSVEKAAQIVSDSKQYQYQDQIVSDINAYAAKTGVSVTGYDFGATDKLPASSASSGPNSLPKVSGVKTISVTLTLASPMSFDNYLRFVKAIETNLTKMQVSGINISPDNKTVGDIINPSVVLIVYVR